jgi:hypothetical protein
MTTLPHNADDVIIFLTMLMISPRQLTIPMMSPPYLTMLMMLPPYLTMLIISAPLPDNADDITTPT